MGNQQPRALRTLCINAKLGDGYFWKHPECRNYKLIYTSTTLDLLHIKRNLLPDIFPTEPKVYREANASGAFKNAKPLYRLASTVHPVITEYAKRNREDVLQEICKDDVALWYLDDGTLINRFYTKKDGSVSNHYKALICIGDIANTDEKTILFLNVMEKLFGTRNVGRITLNNPKATLNNKVWWMPKQISSEVLDLARKYGVLLHKFPQG